MAKAEMALCVGGAMAFVTGLLDDLLDLAPRKKLLGQMLAGGALLAGGIQWPAYPALTYLPFLNLGAIPGSSGACAWWSISWWSSGPRMPPT